MSTKPEPIQRAIDAWLAGEGNSLLIKEIPALEKMWEDRSIEEDDPRTGDETYGYVDPKGTMEYISDRWRCAFRIRWVLDGLENGAIK